jgi:hypothetical protein
LAACKCVLPVPPNIRRLFNIIQCWNTLKTKYSGKWETSFQGLAPHTLFLTGMTKRVNSVEGETLANTNGNVHLQQLTQFFNRRICDFT